MNAPRLRVMQSFRAPRNTTNPYNTMLDSALAAEPSIEHLRYSWGRALFGRYDVFHWHWPETLLHGSNWWKSAGRFVLTTVLATRHALSPRIATVRTVHNIELPDDNAIRLWLLRWIDRQTTYRIVLNTSTDLPADQPHVLIRHGHYRDWYERFPTARRIPGRIGTFGGVRRYKNAGALVDAYTAACTERSDLSLRIGGRASSPQLAADLRERAASSPGIQLDLDFLSDEELVRLATESELVVLAYRFMHNSGSVLAALSLDRPVLVPRNEVNEQLSAEVGSVWVQMYDEDVTGSDLLRALDAVSVLPEGERPDLHLREWSTTASDHATAYRTAQQIKRGHRP